MRSTVTTNGVLLIAGAGLSALCGCSRKAGGPLLPASIPPLELPEPTPPRPPLPPELATLVYPEVDKVVRDPFLTVLEQAAADGVALPSAVTPETKAALADAKLHHRGPPPVIQRIIRQLHDQVHGIILGSPNVFIFKGRTYQEGDVIDGTDWVVVSVQESGIRLRSRDGSGSDYLPFTTSATVVFEFKDQGPETQEKKNELPVDVHKP